MSISRIYCPVSLQQQTSITLPMVAAHHVLQVLRCKVGECIHIFNSTDGEFEAEIITLQRKNVLVRVSGAITPLSESPLHIHLGQAISRGERMDYAIQKAVELGVTEITPLMTQRCNVRLSTERLDSRLVHWQNIAISASEQCGRIHVPQINRMQTWSHWLSQTPGLGIICSLQGDSGIWPNKPDSIKLFIGPEGGLTSAEIQEAINRHHCLSLSLGPRVLRTETATVVALTLLQRHWGDLYAK